MSFDDGSGSEDIRNECVCARDRRFQVSKYGIIEVAKEGKNEGSVGN